MPHITPWAFVLAVSDFNRTANYFRDVLGFRILWEEATDWCRWLARPASSRRTTPTVCGDVGLIEVRYVRGCLKSMA
jgi:hypothetical protein